MDESWQIKKIETSSHFERAFRRLPAILQKKVFQRVAIFKNNPFDPRLDTHKLKGKLSTDWSFSVDYHNRVRFRFVGEATILLIDVGSHDIYKR